MRQNYEPLSNEDRHFLLTEAEPSGSANSADIVHVFVWSVVGTMLYSALALLGFGVLARLAGFQILGGAWRENTVTYAGAIVTIVGIFAYVVTSSVRWLIKSRQSVAANRRSVFVDLEKGVVKVERLDVEGIKLLQEPEHDTFIFLVNLSNGKTIVLYDYNSFDENNDHPSDTKPRLQVRERITLRTFPKSKRKRWEFEGARLALPDPVALALDPEKWPEDESWCRVMWENIERHYGPQADR